MTAAPWIFAYAVALVLWLVFLIVRRQPTLWKGRALLWMNAAFFVAIAATELARAEEADSALLGFQAFLLLSAALTTNVWLLVHISRPEIDMILEKCFAQTRARHDRTPDGYNVVAGSGEMRIALAPLGGLTRVHFSGADKSKKAELIKSLITKQFETSFPKPRFRT